MPIRFGLKNVTFSGGSVIEFPESSITVIVGPNNSGKSTFLNEVHASLIRGASTPKPKTFAAMEARKDGGGPDIEAFLRENGRISTDIHGREIVSGMGASEHLTAAISNWLNRLAGMGNCHSLLMRQDQVLTRIGLCNAVNQIDLMHSPPSHPIHQMQLDERVEARVSKYFKEAFGEDLIVNHANGSSVPLHVGKRPNIPAGSDRLSRDYREALKALPLVEHQGDGIKAFVGSILSILVDPRPLTLTDEPEAFLHPPQARILGFMLGREFAKEKQLVMATHSGDVLRGLLDSGTENLRIIRIVRSDKVNSAYLLNEADIRSLWSDSILRFSNVLDGLFHESVVLCESDSDCRFYSAIAHALADEKTNVRRPDIMFSSSGGKDRLPTIIKALAKLKVSTRVVADFDILRGEDKFKEIVVALGGDWAAFEKRARAVRAGVEQKSPPLNANQVSQEIITIIKSITSPDFPENARKGIEAAMKASSPWVVAKAAGRSSIPPGQATTAFNELLSEAKKIGLWIVPIGELECFDKTVGLHGPAWVSGVLQKDLLKAPELEDARGFVAELVAIP